MRAISHAVPLGAERIYVLPTENPADDALPRPPWSALSAGLHAITLLTNARLRDNLDLGRPLRRPRFHQSRQLCGNAEVPGVPRHQG